MAKKQINLLIGVDVLSKIQELYKKQYPTNDKTFSRYIEEIFLFYITERDGGL